MAEAGFCTACGAELIADARFCHECGAAVTVRPAASDEARLDEDDEGMMAAFTPSVGAEEKGEEVPAPEPEEVVVEFEPETEPKPEQEPLPVQDPVVSEPVPAVVAGPPPAQSASPPPPVVPTPPPPAQLGPPPAPGPAFGPPPVAPSIPYGSPALPQEQPTVSRTRGVEGPNIIAFPTLTQVLEVTTGLAADPSTAQKLKVNPYVATSLDSKLSKSLEALVAQNGLPGLQGQASHFVKSSATNLFKGITPPRSSAPPEQWVVTIQLTGEEVELYNLCLDDAQRREGLEDRILRTCGSCKFQRIINPDYESMMARRRMADMLINWKRSVLRAVGRSNADPTFVCMRCQGLTYTDRTIVLCPGCGTPNMSLLLGRCGQCGWDFVSRAPGPPKGAPKKAAPKPEEKMLVGTCSKCSNKIKVPLSRVPAEGLKGKCGKCGQPVTFRRPKAESAG